MNQIKLLERLLVMYDYDSIHYVSTIVSYLRLLANAYGTLKNNRRRKWLLKKALTMQDKHTFMSRSLDALCVSLQLSYVYECSGNYQQQKLLVEIALILAQDFFRPHDFRLAEIMEDLCDAFIHLGKLKSAKELLEKVLIIKENHWGSDNFKIVETLTKLSIVYGELDEIKTQKHLLDRALKIVKQTSQNYPHPLEVALRLYTLSDAYGSLGDVQKENELLEQAQATAPDHEAFIEYRRLVQDKIVKTHFIEDHISDSWPLD